jgi:hypothetical protein
MPSKGIEIFTKASIFLKIFLKCHEFLKTKTLAFSKKKKKRFAEIAAFPQ